MLTILSQARQQNTLKRRENPLDDFGVHRKEQRDTRIINNILNLEH